MYVAAEIKIRAEIFTKTVLDIFEPDKNVPFNDKTNEHCAYAESGFVEIRVERNRWDRQVRVSLNITRLLLGKFKSNSLSRA